MVWLMAIDQIWLMGIDQKIFICYIEVMRPEFNQHNLFRKSIGLYLANDPNLSYLESLKYVLEPNLVDEIPIDTPGVYILTGARQVGKSTLVKLLIKKILSEKKQEPEHIFYLPCDLIISFHELINEVEHFLSSLPQGSSFYLFIDEITYVKSWDRAVKHFADLGYFRRGSVLITGSDSSILKEGMKRFPGRRGTAPETDFHYYPLSFGEYVLLVEPELEPVVRQTRHSGNQYLINPSQETAEQAVKTISPEIVNTLTALFERYLISGGFLTAINELGKNDRIGRYVYNTYIQWIIGDFLKRNKKEHSLKEIMLSLSHRLGKQVSFQNITSATGIQHHSTTQEYLQMLLDMDVIFVLEALREDKLTGAPKKQKKIQFSDPFIAATSICWARGIHDYWEFVQQHIINDSLLKSEIVEGVIASLFRRHYKTYYIKGETEVDISIVTGERFFPIEIKYAGSLKANELKQILKYPHGIVAYKGDEYGRFRHLDVLPLPVTALFVK